MRLAIANSNAYELRTGVRWELHRDFACRDLDSMGRFDVYDLFSPEDPGKVAGAMRAGLIIIATDPEAWDFDALRITHTCPKCQKPYNKEFVVFNPSMGDCRHCGFQGYDLSDRRPDEEMPEDDDDRGWDLWKHRFNKGSEIAKDPAYDLLSRVGKRQVGLLSIPGRIDLPEASLFLDIHATPLFCWLVLRLLPSCSVHAIPSHDTFWHGGYRTLTYDTLQTCFDRSLFAMLRNEYLADNFVRIMDQFYDSLDRSRAKFDQQSLRASVERDIVEHPGLTDEERRQTLDLAQDRYQPNCKKERERLHRDVQNVRELYRWVFGDEHQKTLQQRNEVNSQQPLAIRTALRRFPDHMENLLDYVGKHMTEGENP